MNSFLLTLRSRQIDSHKWHETMLLLIGTLVLSGVAAAQGATARTTVNSFDAKGVGTVTLVIR